MVSTSTVPLSRAFFHALLLELAREPDGLRRREIYEPVALSMQLTPEQQTERLPTGAHLRYRLRIGWALNMLKHAGLVELPASRRWRLTARGRALLAANPGEFDEATLRDIEREARSVIRADLAEDLSSEQDTLAIQQTPEERIDAAMKEIEGAVSRELLDRILQAPAEFFEELVLKLLRALGYGTSESDVQRTGGVGDAGIDGVISLDKLGFEKVYIQAKRWQTSVGRPEVQGFFGALAGRKARKGVFITTSSFTREARDYGGQVSDSLVLIDGLRLTALMIEHGVGVTHPRVLRVPRVDGDYFDTE
ncbi:MAG TPA: restriction endonuclease [Thermoanaerobaculia bacterium]|nr:restriction endonuclease [Thermoanaerobaculia bacterium]